jgi:hypothetical protein
MAMRLPVSSRVGWTVLTVDVPLEPEPPEPATGLSRASSLASWASVAMASSVPAGFHTRRKAMVAPRANSAAMMSVSSTEM